MVSTFCLCRTSKSARNEGLGPSQVFPGQTPSPGHVHIPTRVLGLLGSQGHSGTLVAQIFPFRFLVSFLFSPAVIATSVSYDVWRFPLMVFKKMLSGEKKQLSLGKFWVKSNKDKPLQWDFPGNCQTDQIMTVFWELGFEGTENPFSPHPEATRLLVFLGVCGAVGFQGCHGAGEEEMALRRIKMQQSFALPSEIRPCFLNKYSWIVPSLWLISRGLKRWFWFLLLAWRRGL